MDDTPSPTDLALASWDHLDDLATAGADLAEQAAAVVAHTVTWALRPDGFEPSPVCVLRPLAAALDPLADVVRALGRRLDEQWTDLDAGLRRTAQDLVATEHATAVRLARLDPGGPR